MNFKQVKSSTFALLAAGLLLLIVGTYTENGGFQLAGGMLLVITVILALTQANR